MMSVLYIASDGRGAGKTALSAALAVILSKRGGSVGVFKPFAALGMQADSDPDGASYHALTGQAADGWPVDSAGGLTQDAIDGATRALARVSEGKDAVIVEGSNALSPQDTARLAAAMDARVVVVSAYRRELTAADLASWRDSLADSLTGCVVNGLTRHLGTEAQDRLLPSFETEKIECLGLIPEVRRLLGVSVGQLAQHLDGRFVSDSASTDSLLERFQVGALSLDPGELWFAQYDDNAVIVRGDRPDVQMSALRASISCLVLTNGIDPIEYVTYEAEQEEVPVMVVDTDTIATMDALNTLTERALFDHPRKLERYIQLVEECVDLDPITAALGIGV
jgi:BioD-like phosphotransacetylase family protein